MKNNRYNFRWIFKTFFILAIVGSAILMFLGSGLFWYFSKSIPDMSNLKDYQPLLVSQIKTTDGEVIGEFYKERRYVLPIEKIPQKVIQAFISAEDDQFFSHQGVNFASILRAALANFRAGHVVQGGSTITQQVAKSLLLTPEKSFDRKLKELIIAGRLEKNLTKQQILYLYLNQIYLGHGAYGVQGAAKTYFDKDVSQLTVGEAAMIAGLNQAPGKYSPHQNPKRARERQLYVLRRMVENKVISPLEYQEASKENLHVHINEDVSSKIAPYYVEHLRRFLSSKYGDKALYEEGLQVTVPSTTALLVKARQSLQEGLRQLDKKQGYRGADKKYKTEQEIQKAVDSLHQKLLEKRLGYFALTTDGKIDYDTALRESKYGNETELLAQTSNLVSIGDDQLVPGVVVGYDERKKVTIVNCGGPKVEVGAEGIKWTGQSSTPLLLKRGDLVYLKIQKQGSTLVGYLEQKPQLQGALFSMDTLTGVVLGMEGGYDHDQSEFNRAIQAQRQPGSAFKPIIFSAAIEKGFTPASIIVDAPIVYDSAQGKWKPANYEEKFYGDTTFRNALVKSRNIPTIKIVQAIEVPYLIQFAKRIGLNSNFSPDLSIALGSGTVNLADLVKTYAIFPRLGKQIEPIFYKTIKDHNDKVLDETRAIPPINLDRVMGQIKNTPAPISFPLPSEPYQVMDPRTAYIATHLMKDVVNYGTGTDAKQLGRPVAGKTGTTNDYQDAWFVAFTPQVVTGVWVGYDNSRSIGSGGTGAHAALPIWLDFMKSAVTRYPVQDFAIPNGIDFITVDSQTGKRVKSGSSGAILEAFISGTEPDFSQNTDTTQSGNDSNTETDGQNNPGSEKKGTTGTSKTNNSSNQSDFLKGDIN